MAEHKRRPHYEGVELQLRDLDDNICCKDCVFRLPDITLNGGKVIQQYKKATCEAFRLRKPYDVLWNNAECPFYEEDVQGKAIDEFLKEYGGE